MTNESLPWLLDVEDLFRKTIFATLHLSEKGSLMMPEREPVAPAEGWLYSVAKPFISQSAMDNVIQALQSGNVSSANQYVTQMTDLLKSKFQVPAAQPCCNGFAALVLALQASKISKGDKVVVPTFTMIAVANAVTFVGAVPVFVDCAPEDYNPSMKDYDQFSNDSTIKAMIVTHTYGVPAADIEAITGLCERNRWVLIEDISECVGVSVISNNQSAKLLGTFGDFACASMYANKMIQGGDAGFIIAKDIQHAAVLKSLVNHGFTGTYHFVHLQEAINAKVNGLGAALACASILNLEEVICHRAEIGKWFRDSLRVLVEKGIIECVPPCGFHDSPWVFGLKCLTINHEGLRDHLAQLGIETRNYFFPFHLQPMFHRHYQYNSDFPNSERLAKSGFYLPTYHSLRKDDIDYISSCIIRFCLKEDCIHVDPTPLPPLQIKKTHFLVWNEEENQLQVHSFEGKKYSSDHVLFDLVNISQKYCSLLKSFSWEVCRDIKEYLETEFPARCLESEMDYHYLVNQFHITKKLALVQYLSNFEPVSIEPAVFVKNESEEVFQTIDFIPTTSCEIVRECLFSFLHKYQPQNILDLGTLFGSSAIFMALVSQRHKSSSSSSSSDPTTHIYSLDLFTWFEWMERFNFPAEVRPAPNTAHLNNKNFKIVAEKYIKDLKLESTVSLISTDLTNSLPNELVGKKIDFVFSDFTRNQDEWIQNYLLIKKLFLPHKTVIFINGFGCNNSFLPVLDSRIKDELQPLFKPPGIYGAAFLFIGEEEVEEVVNSDAAINLSHEETPATLQTNTTEKISVATLNFLPYHNDNSSFENIYLKLRKEFHHPNSKIYFVPAVEIFLSNDKDKDKDKGFLQRNQWIGIVHGAPISESSEDVPDLK